MDDNLPLKAINSNPKINYNYSWSKSSVIVSSSNLSEVLVSPKVSQFIFLEVDDTKGCIFKDSVFVQVSSVDENLIKAIVSDDYIPVGEKVTLKGSPDGYSYQWTPEESVESPTSLQTIAKPLETTLYYFYVSDGVCTKHDSILVKVFPFICDDPSIFVPNAFSPNGDGNNDVLIVRGKMIKEMTFRVFDRWGELIFETQERGIGWDGTYKGKKIDPDVYDYYLKVTCIDDVESIVKGNITLLK
jgi:gliding motility-associated-like protein